MTSTNDEYKAQLVADAQRELDAAEAAVVKGLAHVAGSREAVKLAKAKLAAVEAADVVYAEPQEHVAVQVP